MSGFNLTGFIDALFLTYMLLIFVRVIFSWIPLPSNRTILIIYRFIIDVTEPYLRIFRRIIPLAGPVDFSPMIALLVLWVIRSILISVI